MVKDKSHPIISRSSENAVGETSTCELYPPYGHIQVKAHERLHRHHDHVSNNYILVIV